MPLSFAEAQKTIGGAHTKAESLGIRVTVAVVDEGGFLIALGRMDGAPPISPQVAEAKAVGAAMLYRDGASLAELAKDRPGFFSVVDRLRSEERRVGKACSARRAPRKYRPTVQGK